MNHRALPLSTVKIMERIFLKNIGQPCRRVTLATSLGKKAHSDKVKRLKSEAPFVYRSHDSKLETDADDDEIFLKDGHNTKESLFVVQPNFKWGRHRHLTKLEESRMEEAEMLVASMNHWKVIHSAIESVHEGNPKTFFGSGKVSLLASQIRDMINKKGLTGVFLNTGKLHAVQMHELEAAWGCKVYDRYRVVLELFKERAKTKEAKLQVQLAEVQYLKSHLSNEDPNYDQQKGGGKSMSGSGEKSSEKRRRVLNVTEAKIRKDLDHLRQHRSQLKAERIRKNLPHVAMVGYTNAGKTTLAKVLSQDASLNPEDKLFATLDSTAHRGKLRSGMTVIYSDTVGFISDLPHELVESFATTLEDLKTADLLIHVCDCSHPEFELQRQTVMEVLNKLDLQEKLLSNVIHVLNKIDLRISDTPLRDYADANVHFVSSTQSLGIDRLRLAIEENILKVTGRSMVRVRIDQSSGELSWMYHHGTVLETTPLDDGSLEVTVVLDTAGRRKFENEFKKTLE